MCSNVDRQGEDTSSYEIQGNNANTYISFYREHHSLTSSPLSVSNCMWLCDQSESLPCDVLYSTLSCDDDILVSEQTLVDPIDDRIESCS